MAASQPVSETIAKEFIISRTFNAPRELVWKAWTEAKAFEEWWGPKGCAVEIEEFDMKPGGKFHYSMQMPNGCVMWGIIHYRELVKPEKIVFVNSFSNEAGEITRAPFSETWPKEVLNVATFTEQANETLMELRGRPINVTPEEQATFEGMFGSMQQGFGGTFDQLEVYLATQ